ncbi:hypothetical protein [Mucilaginibacter rubeus]|uniref:hypothetical protein n=1 Tax=Mucilaginibacter rubeus TaxID=2027860 RepID=UPI001663FE58|nr:hypothetical protein [Mucilaginibacter rubeus]GGA94744.1 hypothetical protein GCM10011500_08110 [Mucilaginibacter rubeus]
MNINTDNQKFRNDIARDLTLLKASLLKVNLEKRTIDTIDTAIKELNNPNYLPPVNTVVNGQDVKQSTPMSWGYTAKNLVFTVDTTGIQYPLSVKTGKLTFDISLSGAYDKSTEILDPFHHLEFNLVLEGLSRKGNYHILSYHLDRHITGGNHPEEVHPIYHFQLGGHRLKKVSNNNFGHSLFIDSPRFMHYPMDIVLGIDFITSNFSPKTWKKLRSDQTYIGVLQRSQKRTVLPFITSLSQHFGMSAKTPNCWKAKDIWPQLL